MGWWCRGMCGWRTTLCVRKRKGRGRAKVRRSEPRGPMVAQGKTPLWSRAPVCQCLAAVEGCKQELLNVPAPQLQQFSTNRSPPHFSAAALRSSSPRQTAVAALQHACRLPHQAPMLHAARYQAFLKRGAPPTVVPFCGQCISPAEQDSAPAHSTGLRGWCHGWIVSCRAMRLLPGLQRLPFSYRTKTEQNICCNELW